MSKTGDVLEILEKEYPKAYIALNFSNPLELLVATILSAQCTDERVNMVTKSLFKKYRSVKDYANADVKEFEQDIRSTGFYHNKAKNIIGACKIIMKKHNSKVPSTMGELVELPGVARKTGNIVLYGGFGIVDGIAVDTHVKRLSSRMGLTKNTDPVKIEQDLMKLLPKKDWMRFADVMIWHGRRCCYAIKPECAICVLKKICPRIGVDARSK